MKPIHRTAFAVTLAAALAAAPLSSFACAACGCTVGTEFAGAGYSTGSGWRVDLRYDFVNQNQLRLDSNSVNKKTYQPDDPDQEIQQGTLTRYYTLGIDHSIGRDWGINVQVPYFDREHETIDSFGNDTTTSHLHNIGDVRILGRYQGFLPRHNFGVQFGLTLPTGPTKASFIDGPAAGEQIDRGLQAGTGTAGLLLGLYNFGDIIQGWDRFEQIQYKQSINSNEGFRPASSANANLGVRYVAHPVVIPQVQINLRWEGHEIGANADYANSGDRAVFISPGATVKVVNALHVYGFVQLPVYQFYKGLELAPHYSITAGLSYIF